MLFCRHTLPRLVPILLAGGMAVAAEAPWPADAWPVATPESQGMDSALLEAAAESYRTQSPNRYSFLVVRNGYLVFERYFNGRNANQAEHIASVSKSILSALAGIAIEQGRFGLEDRYLDWFPEYRSTGDPRTADIRVRHLLTMSGGLEWTEGLEPIRTMMATERDWLRYVLRQPMHAAPGERFQYSSGLTHLLAALLRRAVGMTTRAFAVANLFEPLGIRNFDWWVDPQGNHTGGWGMFVTPRDLAKFGLLYLRDGVWDGRQLVPAAWVRVSTGPRIRHNTGDDDFYGYLWWMDNRRGFFMPRASGMGSQYVFLSRELKLVVVTTADYTGVGGDVMAAVNQYVIPSVFYGAPVVNAVVNGASGAPAVAPDSFVSIHGDNFAPAALAWDSVILDGTTLPITLGGVSVSIAGQRCYLSYAGPGLVKALAPPGLPLGPAEVEVKHQSGTARTSISVAAAVPGLFDVAAFANEPVYVAEPGALPGAASRPARGGDLISLYATGLGPTAEPHPAGQVLSRPYAHADPASIRVLFGDVEVMPLAVYMTAAGLWQVNVQVPAVPPGKTAITIRVAGESSPGIMLPIGGSPSTVAGSQPNAT
jgi:uncharacterized protein (TIGR03437 family)